ncbi:alpha/beta fold hydrolase [Apilactobacillus xinyiensis]|uniref:alpha/beta fold hydrolase n=1 Tax=Apilactobacillus xinyiensis TaxID=2841032 RepID=UPI002034C94A|nr:hypothetical protein [Apilactobacillus xinyiensis]
MDYYKYTEAPNKFIKNSNKVYAYRELGRKTGIPIIFFTHLAGNLDNWDPRIIDEISKYRWVITFDNLGIGLSNGKVPNTIEEKWQAML